MNNSAIAVSDYRAITEVVQLYIDGAKNGKSDTMKYAYHKDATIYGYLGPDLLSGSIQQLFAWVDKNDPANDLQAEVASIDIVGSIAIVNLELDNWLGYRFTDVFSLVKVDSEWKIMSKAFHMHM